MKRILYVGALVAIFLVVALNSGSSFGQAKKVGGGDIKYTETKGMAAVTFSHAFHDGKGLKCTDCHTKIFKMKKGEAKVDMATLNKGEACGTCHNGQKVFPTKAPSDCARCHVKG